MTHAAAESRRRTTWQLGVARVCAWACLLAAWLSLGEAGVRRLPHWAGGLLPLALWLLAIAAGLQLARFRPPTTTLLRAGLPLLGLAAAALVVRAGQGETGALLILAPAWAALLVLASHTVRGLRHAGTPSLPTLSTPVLPACLGAMLALAAHDVSESALAATWLLPGGLANPGVATAALLLAASLVLGVLVPRDMARAGACRAGLFDCSLPLAGNISDTQGRVGRPQATGSPGKQPLGASWPLRSAGLLMLPMMAALPAMAPWCGGTADGPALSSLHLASMLVPALLLSAISAGLQPTHRPRGTGTPRATRRILDSWWPATLVPRPGGAAAHRGLARVVAACLGAGVLCWALLPPGIGLLALSLCHGCAWSLAWAGPMLLVDRSPATIGVEMAGAVTGEARVASKPATLASRRARTGRSAHPGQATRRRWFSTLAQLTAAPVLMLALGWSLAHLGAPALIAVHLALAFWAITGVWLSCSLDLSATAPDQQPAQVRSGGEPAAGKDMARAPTWRPDLP